MGAHAAFLSEDPDLQDKLDEFTNGAGVDLIILTANPWPAYRTAVETVRHNGRVSIVALSGVVKNPWTSIPWRWSTSTSRGSR